MTESKRVLRRSLGSDLAHIDVHVIQPHEYDEIPELTDIAAIAIPLRSAYNPIYACRTRSSWSSDSPLPAITMRPFSST